MVTFYRLADLRTQEPDRFADAWFANGNFAASSSVCSKCGKSKEARKRLGELIIEWPPPIDEFSPGSDVIADFYIVGYLPLSIMISDRFYKFLVQSEFRSFDFGPIHMFQDPKLKRPKRPTARTKKRVWLPYVGAPLHELIVTGNANIDFGMNQVEVSEHVVCSRCQRYQKVFLRPSNMAPWIVRHLDWDGADFFRLTFPDPAFHADLCYVTEKLRDALLAEGFTNLGFEPHGYIE